MSIFKIKLTSVITYIIFSFLVYLTLSQYIITEHNKAFRHSILNTQKYITKSISVLIEDEKNIYIQKAKQLFSKNDILDAMKKKDREKFHNLVAPYFDNMRAIDKNFWGLHIIFKDNMSFIRLHKPSAKDSLIKRGKKPLIDKVNDTHKLLTGVDDGKFGYFIRIIFPIFSKQNEYLGAAEFSINIDSLTQHIKSVFGYEAMFLIDNIHKKKFLSQLPKTSNNLTIFKSTSEEITNIFSSKNTNVDDISIINVSGQKYKISKVLLSKTGTLIVAFDVTKPLFEKDKFSGNINFFMYIILLVSAIVWIIATRYYLNYFTLEEKNKKDLEKKVKEKTIELEEKVIQVEAANKSKNIFLANMSHEIRTPLNAILGFVDLIKEENKGKKSERYVDIVYKSSQTLLNIIEDILDFSKIESGKLNIEKIYFDPKSELKAITDLFIGNCSQNNILLNVNIDDNMPDSIKTDPLRVKQVILNLLSNAVKFTDKNKNIFIGISFKENMLSVFVKDEGIGISKDKLEHIFEAFNQEDDSTTRKYGGTGLGLSISSKLVELLGGKLKVESEVGVGSKFYFSIPVEAGKKLNSDEKINDTHNFKDKKVLVVEDNKSNQMLMEIILEKMELLADFANDGVEAVEMFKKNKYDVILMDENMPNMNGIEATKYILEFEKENSLSHTPIVALTANAIKGDRERFLNSGMDEYLTKPINTGKLNEVLIQIFI